jgi:hypothetical protein
MDAVRPPHVVLNLPLADWTSTVRHILAVHSLIVRRVAQRFQGRGTRYKLRCTVSLEKA